MIQKLITILFLAIIVLPGCKNKSPQELIEKKWKIKELKPGPDVVISDSLMGIIVDKVTMEFKPGNKYELEGMGPKLITGSYTLSADGKLLTVTPDETNVPEIDTIKVLTDDKLVIHDEMGNILTGTD